MPSPTTARFTTPRRRIWNDRSLVSAIVGGMASCLVWATVASGELPMPRLDRLTPLGASAGSEVVVEVVGADLEDAQALWFDQPGLTARPVAGKERQFQLTVAAETPSGTYDVWVVGRYGISNPRLFAVSRGLSESAEVEPNNGLDKAQPIPLNAAINGSSDQNDQDWFEFTAKQGQRLTIQCYAGRLDSPLDANLTVLSSSGATLAANGDYFGRDPFVDFVAPADGRYFVALNDLSFRGGHPYRLVLSDRPQIENVFPRAVVAGQTTELTFYGRNLAGGSAAGRWRVNDLPLDELRRPVTPTVELLNLGAYRFGTHPTAHSTLPTAATGTLVGFTAATGLEGALDDATPLLVVDQPVTLEAEPNGASTQSQPLTLPAIVSGRFDEPRDADWYEVSVGENGSYMVEVYCERIAGRADPYVAVFDEKNNRVTELDDYGHRVNAFDGHLRDPSGSVNLNANQKYRLLVQDRYSRGGARFQYVLKIAKPTPDFFVAAIHHQNPGPGGGVVRRGGATHWDLIVHAVGGFAGPITVRAEETPPGVRITPTTIVGTSGPLVAYAAPDAPEGIGSVRLVAEGKRGEEVLRREVRPYTRVWNDPNLSSSRPLRTLPLAVRSGAPFAIHFEPARIQIVAGSKGEAKAKLNRLQANFQASVNLLPLNAPGNFKVSNQEIGAGASEATLPIEVQQGTRPGVYHLTWQGQAQVPFSKDPQQASPPNTLVSLPSIPLEIEVVAPQ